MKKIFLLLLILISCLSCDQITKVTAKNYLSSSQPISYLNNTFRFQYAENSGAFLNLGSHLNDRLRFWILTLFVAVFLGGMLIYLLVNRNKPFYLLAALTCIIGGGASNLLDRIINNGAVIDFMNLGIGNIRTGIFNLADVMIMAGTMALLLHYINNKRLIG